MPITALTTPLVVAVPASSGDVLTNASDPSQSIAVDLSAPGPGLCWQFGGASVSYTADPASACLLTVVVRLADDSADDFTLFQSAFTHGGPAPIYLPRARSAPVGRPVRVSLDADSGGAAAYLVLDIWQGQS